MTEKRKQELKQLLEEATGRENLEIRYVDRRKPIPIDVYRSYLRERWASYGVDLLSFSRFPFSARFKLEIQNERINSELLSFIGGVVSPYLEEDDIGAFLHDSIRHANYIIETDSTDRSHLHNPTAGDLHLSEIIERLLELTLVRGAETAVSVLDQCCAPEGIHHFCQLVALIDGIKIEKEIPVFKGVRLVPLPSSKTSEELAPYLPNLPANAFSDGFIDSTGSFFEKNTTCR